MRNLKKVLGLVLCLAMMLSIMVVGAAAAFSDAKDINTKYQEAVDMCVALNIINGNPDGSFAPNENVTREQMAKMICVLDAGGKEPSLSGGSTFTDVPSTKWSSRYIESCYARGIVAGVGGGKFNPTGAVTATQAAKMLLVELGYNQDTQKYVGSTWATYVNLDATKKGYYEGLEDIDVSAPLSRKHAAQMIWNALQAKEVEYDYTLIGKDGNLSSQVTAKDKADTLMQDKYKGLIKEGTLTSFTYDSNNKEWTYVIKDDTALSVKSKNDYTDLLGQLVKAPYKASSAAKKDAYGIFATDSVVVASGVVGDLDFTAGDNFFKYAGAKYKVQTSIKDVKNLPVYYFQNTKDYNAEVTGNPNTLSALHPNLNTGVGDKFYAQEFDAIDKDGDGNVDFLMLTNFKIAKVTYVSSTQFKYTNGPSAATDLEDVNIYDGVKKNDYVILFPAAYTADNTDTFVKADMISGTITSAKNKDTDLSSNNGNIDVQVDGTWYTFLTTSYANWNSSNTPDTELTDAVVVNGYIYTTDATNSKSVSDFAVVIGIDNKGLAGTQAKLLFSDGSKTIVNTDKSYNIPAGTLVTYKTNSDKEYVLSAVDTDSTSVDYGFKVAGTVTSVDKASNSSSKAGYVSVNGVVEKTSGTAKASIADDAVIFVAYNKKGSPATYSYKVITGAQMKKMAVSNFDADSDFKDSSNVSLSYAVASKPNNTYIIDMAYVSISGNGVEDADTYYAYVTGVQQKNNSNGDAVNEYTLWTKDGEKVYLGVSSPIKTATDREVIEYKLNSDNELTVVNNWTIGSYNAASGYATIGITDIGGTLQFKINGTTALVTTTTNNKYFEINSDTEYLYIENTDKVGKNAVAIDTADDATTADQLVSNAFIVWEASGSDEGDVLLIVYDVDNNINK